MKNLLLSTSLIAAVAAPAFAGTATDLSGSAETEIQLNTPAADASGEASVTGETHTDVAPLKPLEQSAEELAEEAEDLAGETRNTAKDMVEGMTSETDMSAMETLNGAELTAEGLTGAWTYDANDEHIGEVSEVVLNTNGNVDGVIIDVGGFLGIGEKPVELSLDQLEINKVDNDIRVSTDMTHEQLENMPEYEPS